MATYRVKPGDNLWTIGQKLFGDGRAMKRIMYLNGLDSTTIRPGMTLKLPTSRKPFRITNAEANKFGLASEQQIASGMASGGQWKDIGGLPKQPKVDPSSSIGIGAAGGNVERQQELEKFLGNQGKISTSPLTPGKTDIGIGAAGRQQERNQELGISQGTKARQTYYDNFGGQMVKSQGPTAQVQGAGVFTPNTRNYGGEGPYVDTIRPQGQQPGTVRSRGPSSPWNDVSGPPVNTFSFPGGNPPPTGFFNTGYEAWDPPVNPQDNFNHVQTVVAQLGGTTLPPGADGPVNAGPDFAQIYGEYFDAMFEAGTMAARIPTNVMLSGAFPYTTEEMRAMGYTISPDGKYFTRVKKMTDTVSASAIETAGGYNSFTGRTDGGGGGSSGGGGFTYGGGGGGGGGGSQLSRAAGGDSIVRSAGSWKGINFG